MCAWPSAWQRTLLNSSVRLEKMHKTGEKKEEEKEEEKEVDKLGKSLKKGKKNSSRRGKIILPFVPRTTVVEMATKDRSTWSDAGARWTFRTGGVEEGKQAGKTREKGAPKQDKRNSLARFHDPIREEGKGEGICCE